MDIKNQLPLIGDLQTAGIEPAITVCNHGLISARASEASPRKDTQNRALSKCLTVCNGIPED